MHSQFEGISDETLIRTLADLSENLNLNDEELFQKHVRQGGARDEFEAQGYHYMAVNHSKDIVEELQARGVWK